MSHTLLETPSFPRFEDLAGPADDGSIRLWEVTPAARPGLPYRILLPASWNREDDAGDAPGADGQAVRIGLFGDAIAPDAAIVQISCWKLPAEVGMFDWLNVQAEAFGVEVISGRLLDDGSGEAVDVVAWCGPAENRYIARVLCRADGGFIFILLAMAPEDRYEALSEDLARAVASFQLKQPRGPGQLEPWERADVESPDFKVAYPGSWVAKVASGVLPGKSAVELFLRDGDEGQVLGYVRVKAIDPALAEGDAEALFQLSHEELTEGPVSLSGEWETDEDPVIVNQPGMLLARHARGTMNASEVEVRIAVVERGALRFCAAMISVTQAADALLWMRTKRAFAIALGTAGPNEE